MRGRILLKPVSQPTWDSLISTFHDASYRQNSSYAAAAARRVGAKSELNGFFDGRELIGLADVRVKTIPLTSLGIAYVSYGPLTAKDGGFSAETFGLCLEALCREYVERRGLLLRLIPPLTGGMFRDAQVERLEASGFRPDAHHRPRETFVVDLARPLATIRSGFDPIWRRDLVKAEKADLRITRSVALEDFDHFEQIFLELTETKDFKANEDVSFFRSIQPEIAPDQKFVLHLAWHGAELVAGHLGSFVGDTVVYLLGAATPKGRDLRASYLLQWAVLEYAQSIGLTYYDLGGFDQQQNPGVFRFKKRLNGRAAADAGPYERAPGNFRKGMLQFLEAARAAVRR